MARVGDAAQLAVPLRAKGQTIGSLSISDRAGRLFTEAEARLLQAFADQAALALENARLYAETIRRRHEAEELARLAQTLTESLDVSDVVGRTVESVLPLFGARPRYCGSCSPTARWWRWRSGGSSRDGFEPGHVLPSGIGVLGRAVAEGRAVWSADVFAESGRALARRPARGAARLAGEAAMLAVPLRVKRHGHRRPRHRRPPRPALHRGGGASAPGLRRPGGAGAGERAAVLAGARRGAGRSPRWPRSSASSPPSSTPRGCSGLIVERSGRLFDAEGGIYLLDDDGMLVRRAWTTEGPGAIRVTPGETLPGSGGRRAPRRDRQRLPALAAGPAGLRRPRHPPRDGPAAR